MNTLELFPDLADAEPEAGAGHFHDVVSRYGFTLEQVDIGDITFQASQAESVHRWYRLTPSFAPSLVRHFLDEFAPAAGDLVLDPFSGRGTTVIECKKAGVSAIGTEINPLLQQVGALSLRWQRPPAGAFTKYLKELQRDIAAARGKTVERIAEELQTAVPTIHDVFRWWQPGVLKNLLIARHLSRHERYRAIGDSLWLAINSASLNCANIHRNHPTITFDDDHERDIDVYDSIAFELQRIASDLADLTDRQLRADAPARIELFNACEIDKLFAGKAAKSRPKYVITSPPYPNRFSYVHQTRPQLHFMEVISEKGDATEIDLKTIGGTWGRATSDLMKQEIAVPKKLKAILDYGPSLRPKSLLMCNYATKYFLDINRHIEALRKIVPKGFRGAYVVGNSRLSGVEIYTECILARLFELNGFTVDKIKLFRKRGGRKRLYETAVCVRG